MEKPILRLKKADGSEFPDYTQVPFGSIIDLYTEKTKSENEEELLSCSIEGIFLNSELFDHQRGKSTIGYKKIDMGTLVLSAQNLHLGNANVNLKFEKGMISPAYNTYHIKNCDVRYLAQWIKREKTKKFFFDATTMGASECRRNVEWDTLYESLIALPSIEEQKKIVEVLESVDDVISICESELQNRELQKKSVMQKVFSQQVRFKKEDGSDYDEWLTVPLNYFLEENKERNKDKTFGKEDVLSISKDYGAINQIEYLGKSMAGADVSNYHRVYEGDIVYTKSPLGKQPYGIIKCSKLNGIVSTLYAVYHCKNVIPELIDYYFSRDEVLNNYLKPLVNIGAKHDMKVSNEHAISGNVSLPKSIEEQRKIVELFNKFDEAISITKEELEKYREMKKGLLQQMFV